MRNLVWLAVVAGGACGDNQSVPPVTGRVDVTVLADDGTPAANVTIGFSDPGGALAGSALTDADGHAAGEVIANGGVFSISERTDHSLHVFAVLGVQPRDQITLGVAPPVFVDTGTFDVAFTALAGADHYRLETPCGPYDVTPPTATVTIDSSCVPGETALQLVARDIDDHPLKLVAATMPSLDHGTVTMPAAYQDLGSFAATYSAVPADVSEIAVERQVPIGGGGLDTAQGNPTAGALALSVASAAGSGTISSYFRRTDTSEQTLISRAELSGYEVDVRDTLLPWIGDPTLDVAQGILTIPFDDADVGPDAPDAMRVGTRYTHADGQVVVWEIYASGPQDLVLPHPPSSFPEVAPRADDEAGFTSVLLFESDTISGYAAVRKDPEAALQTTSSFLAPTHTRTSTINSTTLP